MVEILAAALLLYVVWSRLCETGLAQVFQCCVVIYNTDLLTFIFGIDN